MSSLQINSNWTIEVLPGEIDFQKGFYIFLHHIPCKGAITLGYRKENNRWVVYNQSSFSCRDCYKKAPQSTYKLLKVFLNLHDIKVLDIPDLI